MTFQLKRGDTSPALRRTFTDKDGTPIDISGATVTFSMGGCGALIVDKQPCVVEGEQAGTVTYYWRPEDTATAGVHQAEFEVTYPGGAVETVPNVGFMVVSIAPDLAGE